MITFERNPQSKPCSQVRPSSAINRKTNDKEQNEILNRKIDVGILRHVLEKLGIFIPVEQFETMLNAFKVVKNKFISYPDFIRVFVKTDYPQPFMRTTHLEKNEDYEDITQTPYRTTIRQNANNFKSLSKLWISFINLLKARPISTDKVTPGRSRIASGQWSRNRRGHSAYTIKSSNSKRSTGNQFATPSERQLINNNSSTQLIASHNNILSSNSPIVINPTLKNVVVESVSIQDVLQEEKQYQKTRPSSSYVNKSNLAASRSQLKRFSQRMQTANMNNRRASNHNDDSNLTKLS